MIQGAFALIEYMQDTTTEILGSNMLHFHPGAWSPDSADEVFATYKVVQNVDYDQPYIHIDNLTATIYHPDFTTLQNVGARIITRLNQEAMWRNQNLYARGLVEGVRFDDVAARITGNDSSVYIEGTEHFSIKLDITYQYVVLRNPFMSYLKLGITA